MTKRKRAARAAPEGPIRAVIYTRLSRAKTGTTEDVGRRNTEVGLETQRAGCERAIAALGGTVVAVESDVAAGDRLDVRHGLFRAVERIEAGEANALIVYSLERLSRDQLQQSAVVQALRRAGGRLLSATENVEDGPLGDLMRAVYAFGGAYELAKTRERVNRALDAKFRQSGRYKPAQRPPYGYRRIGSGETATYEVDPTEAAIVRRIFSERAAGASLRGILLALNADGIATPTGRGHWSTHAVSIILERAVYWTGEHEVWRTKTVRDADGVPSLEPRPAEDRYRVAFPPFIDPHVAAQAQATASRNVWKKARADRPAEFGIGRYGFFRCSGCGRALSLIKPTVGNPRYACGARRHVTRPCPAPVSITMEAIDGPVWWWLLRIFEDPDRAEGWRVVAVPSPVDALTVQALQNVEAAVADLEGKAGTLLENLSLLTGPAAAAAAQRLNAIQSDLEATREARDHLASAAANLAAADLPAEPKLVARDALAGAVRDAIRAMWDAEPEPERTHSLSVSTPEGRLPLPVPETWRAKRAAMSVLGMSVTVAQEGADQPRWVAEMRLPDGTAISGSWPEAVRSESAYMFPTTRCSGRW